MHKKILSILLMYMGMTQIHAQSSDSLNQVAPIDSSKISVTEVEGDLDQVLNPSSHPKPYYIGQVKVEGSTYIDNNLIVTLSTLRSGEKIILPGADAFARSIKNIWKQKIFSNVRISLTRVHNDTLEVLINVEERPRLSKFISKNKTNDLKEVQSKMGLVKGRVITEAMIQGAIGAIKNHYKKEGFLSTSVSIAQIPDSTLKNHNILVFDVVKGLKSRINDLNFFGNVNTPSKDLKAKVESNSERSHLTFFPVRYQPFYGEKEYISMSQYLDGYGYLSFSKTLDALDPYFRFKIFSSSKFKQDKWDESKGVIIDYLNTLGYRDASWVQDTMYYHDERSFNIDVKLVEGRKYYFGNIAWKGNAKYPDSLLAKIVNIQKGEPYNLDRLNKKLGPAITPEGGDVTSLYQDDGYLFFRLDPVEKRIYNDTIDYEVRIMEGPTATINEVRIAGNDKTKEYVIRRQLRVVPGDKYSRSNIVRSVRELAALNFFNAEKINPVPVPHPENGTVDVNFEVEEKSADKVELSAGWGGVLGLTATVGLEFNNFSLHNIFDKSAWKPLPMGDGQKLSLRVQANGLSYQSYSTSFTEPWIGGKKQKSLTVAFSYSNYSPYKGYNYYSTAGYDPQTNLQTINLAVSMGKQLQWPDDYFQFTYGIHYSYYDFYKYSIIPNYPNGSSNNLSVRLGLSRYSIDQPMFPRTGSNISLTLSFTPPYSLFDPSIATSSNPYKWIEYHKWRLNTEWYIPLTGTWGEDRNKQLVLKIGSKYGYLGNYNNDLGTSPFERFRMGDNGLGATGGGILGYDVIGLRGYPVFQTSDININPEQSSASTYFSIFNKYIAEIRMPLSLSGQNTIYTTAYFEAGNGWYNFEQFNPFQLRKSVGVGVRIFMPIFGLIGFDYAFGLDRLTGTNSLSDVGRFSFILGFEPE